MAAGSCLSVLGRISVCYIELHWLLPGKKYIIVSESVLHYKHKILQMGRYRRG